MKKITTIIASAVAFVLTVMSADMASQPWVNMRIAQQETNTQAIVDLKLSTATGVVTDVWVNTKITDLEEKLMKEIQASNSILTDPTETNAIERAYQSEVEAAYESASFILDNIINF